MPSAHQSTALLCPLLCMISGARYSGVPHNVHVLYNQAQIFNQKIASRSTIEVMPTARYNVYAGWPHAPRRTPRRASSQLMKSECKPAVTAVNRHSQNSPLDTRAITFGVDLDLGVQIPVSYVK